MLWENMTSKELEKACLESNGTCILPIGCIEKHGEHLPLGTDMITARAISIKAAEIEQTVVFPYYFLGQIAEARHMPGTISLKPETIYGVLDELCSEISRNGFKKIIIVNAHGGNNYFLNYFAQCALSRKRDYAVYIASLFNLSDEEIKAVQEMKERIGVVDEGGHADNDETSLIMYLSPELVKMEYHDPKNGVNLNRLPFLNENALFTGIWWYANYPNHFAGNASMASPEQGKMLFDMGVKKLAKAIKAVKEDTETIALQNEFFDR